MEAGGMSHNAMPGKRWITENWFDRRVSGNYNRERKTPLFFRAESNS